MNKPRRFNKDEVIEMLRWAIMKEGGSQLAFAEKHGISPQYVGDVLKRRREPGVKILDALGLERVMEYQKK